MHRTSFACLLPLLAALSGLPALGCTSTPTPKNTEQPTGAKLPVAPVGDETFSFAVLRLLRDGTNKPDRSALLAGTVSRQLSHAAALFDQGNPKRGTAAVLGALALVRIGEGRPDMYGPDGARALGGAIGELSARGDEGRVLAMLELRAPLLGSSAAERTQDETHVAALRSWIDATHRGDAIGERAAVMRAAVGRMLTRLDEPSLVEAARAVDGWIARAISYQEAMQRTGRPPPPEEAQEAFRALQTGAITKAALFLRHGRVGAAAESLAAGPAGQVAPPPLSRLLTELAAEDDAELWRALAQALAREQTAEEGVLRMETLLHDAALWGTALEAYRRDPRSLALAHLLAQLLVRAEMSEVAPLVLADALGATPSAAALSGALAVLAQALEPELDAGSPVTARRIFQSGQLLLRVGDGDGYRGRLEPSPAEIRNLMAGIEIRSGAVEQARPLLLATLEEEPTVWGYAMLGMLERQMGNLDQALAHAQRALDQPSVKVRVSGSAHLLDAVEAHLLIHEVERERKASDKATRALEAAASLARDVLQDRITPAARARAERLLGRALDGLGRPAEASEALERAQQAASSDGPSIGPTMLGVVSRALAVGNVAQARAALQRGIDADVEQEDLVYAALWLMFLEQELGSATDGKVDRVLGRAVLSEGWTGTLARWARGRVDDGALRAAARSYSQRVEAEFYLAMKGRLAGRAGAADELQKVARNPLIDLMEVHLARDIVARAAVTAGATR